MGTLYIDRKEIELRLDGEAIAFYTNGKRDGTAPIRMLKRVIICGRVKIDTSLIHRLAERKVNVIFLSGKRLDYAASLHGRLHNNAGLRIRQYEMSMNIAFAMSLSINTVRKKVTSQLETLRYISEHRHNTERRVVKGIASLNDILTGLGSIEAGPSSTATVMGCEGGASSVYFSALVSLFPSSLNFCRRTRRPPLDPVNAMLSLTYTLLFNESVREAEMRGLDPAIGFYHAFEYGRESLACDLMEPLRPLADRWVWGLFKERVFMSRDFAQGNERPGCYLKKSGRRIFYRLYEEWAGMVRGYLKEEVQSLVKAISG